MKRNYTCIYRHFMMKTLNFLVFLPVFFIVVSPCYSQTNGSKYFSGKPKFINTSAGKALVVDYLRKTTESDDSVKANVMVGMVDLSSRVNVAIDYPYGDYRDFQVTDATVIGIIAYYQQENKLFYSAVGDAMDLSNKKISIPDFVKKIQLLSMPDYVPPTPVQEKKSFMDFLKMDHAYYSFPMRFNILIPFAASYGLNSNFGIEFSNVWSRPKSVVNLKFQISMIWLSRKESGWYERFIIPSYNMGIGFNFIGDTRFNLKPYLTLGWNPVYYYFHSDDNTIISPQNLNNTWYLNSGALNYGIDFEAWIKKGLGLSVSIEQSRYLAELIPDLYGSKTAIALDYFTFKIGLLF